MLAWPFLIESAKFTQEGITASWLSEDWSTLEKVPRDKV
jgi:hypothetical protein